MKEKNAVLTRHAKEMSSAVLAAFPSPLCLAYSAIMTAGISRYIPPNTANPKTARKTDKTDILLDTECTFDAAATSLERAGVCPARTPPLSSACIQRLSRALSL
jgi:hypothetical protein